MPLGADYSGERVCLNRSTSVEPRAISIHEDQGEWPHAATHFAPAFALGSDFQYMYSWKNQVGRGQGGAWRYNLRKIAHDGLGLIDYEAVLYSLVQFIDLQDVLAGLSCSGRRHEILNRAWRMA